MNPLFTYDTFVPGAVLGDWEETLDANQAQVWERLFGQHPQDAPAKQAGMTVALMMRAYLNVVAPRPPGNIHARQQLTIAHLPAVGERVRSRVRCLSKEMRRDRRYLQLEVGGTGADGRALYRGQLNLIWAA